MKIIGIKFTPATAPILAYVEMAMDTGGGCEIMLTSLRLMEPRDNRGPTLSFPRNYTRTDCLQCGGRMSVGDAYCPNCGKTNSRRSQENKGHDIYYPRNARSRELITEAVVTAYMEWKKCGHSKC